MRFKKIQFSILYFIIWAAHFTGHTSDNPGDYAIHIVRGPNFGRQSKMYDEQKGYNYNPYNTPNYGFTYDDINGYQPNYNYKTPYPSSSSNYYNSRMPKLADDNYITPNYMNNQNTKYNTPYNGKYRNFEKYTPNYMNNRNSNYITPYNGKYRNFEKYINPNYMNNRNNNYITPYNGNHRNLYTPVNYLREYNRGRTQRYLTPSSYLTMQPNIYNSVAYKNRNQFPYNLVKTFPRDTNIPWSRYENPSKTNIYEKPLKTKKLQIPNTDKYYWPSKRSWSNYGDYEGPYYYNNYYFYNPDHFGKENDTFIPDEYNY